MFIHFIKGTVSEITILENGISNWVISTYISTSVLFCRPSKSTKEKFVVIPSVPNSAEKAICMHYFPNFSILTMFAAFETMPGDDMWSPRVNVVA